MAMRDHARTGMAFDFNYRSLLGDVVLHCVRTVGPMGGGLEIHTKLSREPVFINDLMIERGDPRQIIDHFNRELERRRRARLFADNRHDHFKGFRA